MSGGTGKSHGFGPWDGNRSGRDGILVLEYWGFPEVPRATRHAGKRVGHGERLLTIGGHLIGLLTIHRKERLLSTPRTRL